MSTILELKEKIGTFIKFKGDKALYRVIDLKKQEEDTPNSEILVKAASVIDPEVVRVYPIWMVISESKLQAKERNRNNRIHTKQFKNREVVTVNKDFGNLSGGKEPKGVRISHQRTNNRKTTRGRKVAIIYDVSKREKNPDLFITRVNKKGEVKKIGRINRNRVIIAEFKYAADM